MTICPCKYNTKYKAYFLFVINLIKWTMDFSKCGRRNLWNHASYLILAIIILHFNGIYVLILSILALLCISRKSVGVLLYKNKDFSENLYCVFSLAYMCAFWNNGLNTMSTRTRKVVRQTPYTSYYIEMLICKSSMCFMKINWTLFCHQLFSYEIFFVCLINNSD